MSDRPIYECITPEALVKLQEYQYNTYGTQLKEPKQKPVNYNINVISESLEEIDRLMRQAPESRLVLND